MSGHGHVVPNPDGSRARCGGPGICAECSKELAQHTFPSGQGFSAVIPVENPPFRLWEGGPKEATNSQAPNPESAAYWRERAEKAEAWAKDKQIYQDYVQADGERWRAIKRYQKAEARAEKAEEYRNDTERALGEWMARTSAAEKALADSKAEVAGLREALRLAARWLGTGEANDTFEDIAEWFRRETGFLRPGKDSPMALGGREGERRTEWFEWAERKGAEVRAVIQAALTPKDGSHE